ncbi:nickel/cobalt efflux transporter RcnA, partial [Bordetella hinzii]|nr:nickel/cobalt efflux transporter RcnA [Bordetella hinzii]
AHDHSAHDHAGHVHDPGAHHHDADDDGHTDAHQRAHARDIRRRFANRDVTHWQIALFGLTGGLIPCPAAITVLLLCLQLKAFTLGAVLVLCFSIGLAITLVTVGVVAALGARQASRRLPGLNTFARRAPYLSSLLILAVGGYLGLLGWSGLSANPAAQNPGTAGLSLPAGH